MKNKEIQDWQDQYNAIKEEFEDIAEEYDALKEANTVMKELLKQKENETTKYQSE